MKAHRDIVTTSSSLPPPSTWTDLDVVEIG